MKVIEEFTIVARVNFDGFDSNDTNSRLLNEIKEYLKLYCYDNKPGFVVENQGRLEEKQVELKFKVQ